MHLLRRKHSWIVHTEDITVAVILKISHLDLSRLSLLVNLLFLALFVVPVADEFIIGANQRCCSLTVSLAGEGLCRRLRWVQGWYCIKSANSDFNC